MSTTLETSPSAKPKSAQPMLQINRLNYVRVSAKVLDTTDQKLKKYLQFSGEQMNTKVTNDDVIEYALTLLFERDTAFRSWLKANG
ncbi:MAG TPA: hypothetical protein PKC65_04260 [Pyrinomonadaceae bacterium]|nr:hypothetical protein [Pyrinomonadaceae bacterium]